MADKNYFQFPLGLLAYGSTVDDRLNTILDYSFISAGMRLFGKLCVEDRRKFLDGKTVNRDNPKGINPNDWLECGAAYGAYVIGVNYRSPEWAITRYRKAGEFVAAFEQKHGRDARVRIRSDFLFKARDHGGLTSREFWVLCAIYSAIGSKELAIVTQAVIRRRALGYRTAAIQSAELPLRTDKAQALTERQLRDTIGRLHRNKFFARSTVARRITYYSIRLDSEAFRKKILDRRTYPAFFRANQTAQDQALTVAIRQRRQELAKQATK